MINILFDKAKFAKFGILVMILLLILSICFIKERMYLLDPSYMLYLFMQREDIAIQEFRIGSFITHIFPVIGIKLGWNLNSIQQAYNISFYTFFLLVYTILLKWKQWDLCLLFLCYLTLFVGDVFFWPNNEVHQGIAWALLALGYYDKFVFTKSRFKYFHLIVFALLMGTAIATHLLVVFAVVVLWILKYNKSNSLKKLIFNKQIILGLLFFSFALGVKFYFSSLGGYDSGKLEPVKDISYSSAYNSLFSAHAKSFYTLLPTRFIVPLLLVFANIFLLVWKRKYLNLAIMLVSILGFWILLNLVYPYPMDRSLWFYMESEYQVLSILLVAPLLYSLNDWKYFNNTLSIIFVLTVVSFSIRLVDSYQVLHKRLNNLDKTIAYCQEKNITKGLLILPEPLAKKYFIMDWGVPIESLTKSNIDIGKGITIKIVHDENNNHKHDAISSKHHFYSDFSYDNIESIPTKYLQLDTIQTYQILDTAQLLPRLQVLY